MYYTRYDVNNFGLRLGYGGRDDPATTAAAAAAAAAVVLIFPVSALCSYKVLKNIHKTRSLCTAVYSSSQKTNVAKNKKIQTCAQNSTRGDS